METNIDLKVSKTLYLNNGTPEQKREEIREYFHRTFDLDAQLFDAIKNEAAYYKRADELRHPLIFYFGHTSTFCINKLILAKLITKRINPKFESMFAVGVDEMSWDDLNDQHYDWPSVSEVREYREQVRQCVDQIISDLPMTLPVNWENPFWVIMMCIEHMRIHFETSSVLMRQLPIEDLQPIPNWTVCTETGEAPTNQLLPVKEGTVMCGKSFDSPLYGWDNEYGTKKEKVTSFQASQYLCSNQEFFEFIEDGGYEKENLWSPEGWKWKSYVNASHPRFWIKKEGEWWLRLFTNEIPLPWSWPVEVNYLEAKAFCNWMTAKKGKTIRLPLEEEWLLLHEMHSIADQPEWQVAPGNINMEHYQSPCPVNRFQFGDFYDLIGNVWQWTETPISGYQGFKVHQFYDDFSVPTFDNQHNMIKGGSWISTGNEATKECRYAFRRHFYQHAGFRYVESDKKIVIPCTTCETDVVVCQNLEEHWGKDKLDSPNAKQQLAQICIDSVPEIQNKRVLDLGCEVGRTSFELAKHSKEVMGLDFTARNIQRAVELKETSKCSYEMIEEEELVSHQQIDLNSFGLNTSNANLQFYQADANNLKSLYHAYDVIIINNALESMSNPVAFLETVPQLLAKDGYVVLACSYNWDAKRNNIENRPGGFRKDGEPLYSSEAIEEQLKKSFTKVTDNKLISRIRKINRYKLEVLETEVSVWKLAKNFKS